MRYFPHDTDSFEDEKVAELYIKYGYEGIGLFYTIIEKIAKQEKPIKTNILKKQLGVGKKLNKVWNFMESLELICSTNDETFNERIISYSENYQIKKENTKGRVSQWREKQLDTKKVTGYKHVGNNIEENKKRIEENKKENTLPIIDNIPKAAFAENFEFGKILNPTSFPNWRTECSNFLKDEYFKQQFCKSENLPMGNTEKLMTDFVIDQNLKNDFKNAAGLKKHFINSYKKNKTHSVGSSKAFVDIPDDYNYDNMEVW